MTEWQDISTAPKDGTLIWLLIDGAPCIGNFQMHWLGEGGAFVSKAKFERASVEQRERGISDKVYLQTGKESAPTRWMPLPEPPK